MVRESDRFPHIDADAFGDQRELVCQRHVHVAERVFHHLDHLGRGGVGAHDRALDERTVQLGSALGARRCQAAGEAIVLLELDQDAAWQDPLGAVRDAYVATRLQT